MPSKLRRWLESHAKVPELAMWSHAQLAALLAQRDGWQERLAETARQLAAAQASARAGDGEAAALRRAYEVCAECS